MKIIHITVELAPIAKVGGLADVVAGLAKEQVKQGNEISIVLPKYDFLDLRILKDLQLLESNLLCGWAGSQFTNHVWHATLYGVSIYLIDPCAPLTFFSRGVLYGCDDDIERFLYFSRVALELIDKMNTPPDVIHLHDWPTAIVAPLHFELFSQKKNRPKIAFTMHNLAHQGICSPLQLSHLGLNITQLHHVDHLQDPNNPDLLNLLKGGIVYSDLINTVSSTYAREILTPEGGKGLETILKQHQQKFFGILNGIDTSYWSPNISTFIPHTYSYKESNTNKKKNKQYLQNKLKLEISDAPLVANIGRIVEQKGLDLIQHTLFRCFEKQAQFILLGVAPDPQIHKRFAQLQAEFAEHPSIHIELVHEEGLVHSIFAASDLFIVPSIFEPCGLTQLIALTHGSIPIVRETGGLKDTIHDFETSPLPINQRNGFTFIHPTNEGVNWALDRALTFYRENPEQWNAWREQVMQQDVSWEKSTKLYTKMYQTAKSDCAFSMK